MSYIGNTSTTQAFTPAVDFFNGNGSTTAFTLSRPVASVAQVQAVISNVPQKPGDAFTVSGNTITFTSAPPSGTQNIYVYYTSPITQVIAPGQDTVATTQIQASAVTPAKLSTGAPTWDANGNVGTGGVTPSNTTGSGVKGLEIGGNGNGLLGNSANIWATQNVYFNAGFKKIGSGYATMYNQSGGAHNWNVSSASGGAAGDAITWTQALAVEKDKTLALQGASSVAGTGIAFPATQSASSDANTLDDYEEGTWTISLTPVGSGSFTLANNTGNYTKIGRVVTVGGQFTITSVSSPTGSYVNMSLPFTAATLSGSGTGRFGPPISIVPGAGSWAAYPTGIQDGSTVIVIELAAASFGTATIRFSFSYFV